MPKHENCSKARRGEKKSNDGFVAGSPNSNTIKIELIAHLAKMDRDYQQKLQAQVFVLQKLPKFIVQ